MSRIKREKLRFGREKNQQTCTLTLFYKNYKDQ